MQEFTDVRRRRDSVPVRLAAFAALLAIAFAGSWALGASIGPDVEQAAAPPPAESGGKHAGGVEMAR